MPRLLTRPSEADNPTRQNAFPRVYAAVGIRRVIDKWTIFGNGTAKMVETGIPEREV